MEFEVHVRKFKYYLSKAATALGSGRATETIYGYRMRSFKGYLQIACTDRNTWTLVITDIPVHGEDEFAVGVDVLHSVVSYLNDDTMISLRQEKGFVLVKSADYVGKWRVMDIKKFPDKPPSSHSEMIPLNNYVFRKSIEAVRYTVEGAISPFVVFGDGLCWAGLDQRMQEVVTGFDSNLTFSIPLVNLGLIKFLELCGDVNDRELKFGFVEEEDFLYLYHGDSLFICQKVAHSAEDIRKRFYDNLDESNQLVFDKEVQALQRAVTLASATCEQRSAIIRFEFEDDKLYVIGEDKHSDFGYANVAVNIKGNKKLMEKVKSIGWHWVLAGLSAVKDKTVTLKFDKEFLIIKGDSSVAIMALVSDYGTSKRVINK